MNSRLHTQKILHGLVNKLHNNREISQETNKVTQEKKEALLVVRGNNQDLERLVGMIKREQGLEIDINIFVEDQLQGKLGSVETNRLQKVNGKKQYGDMGRIGGQKAKEGLGSSQKREDMCNKNEGERVDKTAKKRTKELITENDILTYHVCHPQGNEIFILKDTIITPLALDRAKVLGIEVKREKAQAKRRE